MEAAPVPAARWPNAIAGCPAAVFVAERLVDAAYVADLAAIVATHDARGERAEARQSEQGECNDS
jgi:hypothetical protein